MRDTIYLRVYSSLLLLLACLYLASCSGTTPTTVTPTLPPTATPTTDTSSNDLGVPHTIPQVRCDTAVQMIHQNKVAKVEFTMDKHFPDFLIGIDIYTRDSQQSDTNPFGLGQYGIGPTFPNNCKSQVLAAIHSINKGLPKREQIQVITQISYE